MPSPGTLGELPDERRQSEKTVDDKINDIVILQPELKVIWTMKEGLKVLAWDRNYPNSGFASPNFFLPDFFPPRIR